MIVYLNGSYLPIEEARVSVLDRGFLFGDGVYEVIPAYGGQLFRLRHHLQRLQSSLDSIRLQNPLSELQWQEILENVLQKNLDPTNELADQYAYLQVTRGVAAKRDHRFPSDVQPTVYVNSSPLPAPAKDICTQGIAAITLDDIRWKYCNIKATSLLPNVLLRQQAEEQKVSEAILIRDGLVLEGSASNVFVIIKGCICTPPKNDLILPGITRDLVVELAQKYDLANEIRDIREDELNHADEIWVTSSTREIDPVTRLNGNAVGTGAPGPIWKSMVEHYRKKIASTRKGL